MNILRLLTSPSSVKNILAGSDRSSLFRLDSIRPSPYSRLRAGSPLHDKGSSGGNGNPHLLRAAERRVPYFGPQV